MDGRSRAEKQKEKREIRKTEAIMVEGKINDGGRRRVEMKEGRQVNEKERRSEGGKHG